MDTQQGVLGTNMYVYCLNDPVNLFDPAGTDAYYVVDYNTMVSGIMIVGHSRLLLQDAEGVWWMTEFTGSNKKNARVTTRPATPDDWARAKAPLIRTRIGSINLYTGGASNVLLKGDFTEGLELAKKYASGEKDVGKYTVLINNCLHYVLDIMLASGDGLDDSLMSIIVRVNPLTTIPSLFYAELFAAVKLGMYKK